MIQMKDIIRDVSPEEIEIVDLQGSGEEYNSLVQMLENSDSINYIADGEEAIDPYSSGYRMILEVSGIEFEVENDDLNNREIIDMLDA